jgi:hypothetical protein
MATSLSLADAKQALRSPEHLNGNAFAILGTIARAASYPDQADESRDLLVRMLDRRDDLNPSYLPLLEALVVRLGLYPYVRNPNLLPTSDQLAFEYHRPEPLEEEGLFVFHAMQRVVFDRLMGGHSVVLSAPTSFGKSAITDALVASEKWANIAIVVPTLALIDETRRRLSRFSGSYKIVTYPSQRFGRKTLMVMTQERLLEVEDLPPIGLFVIDEFYKLDPAGDADRSTLLNIAWDRLRRTGAQYYLTGPNVDNLHEALPSELHENLIVTDFRTVAVDEEQVRTGDERERLAEVCARLDPPTLIYCKSPKRVRQVGRWLLEDGLGQDSPELAAASHWVGDNYDPDWVLAKCLKAGIGLHHGRVPRALQHHLVRQFNGGYLKYLVCTSTLIEGVNTAAQNVIIMDGRLSTKKLDYFTFSNIRGRAGRMFKHFVGRVCVFNSPPTISQTTVDIPISSQSSRASTAALVQLPTDELSVESYERLRHIYEQDLLSIEVIRANKGMDPDRQLELAEEIASKPGSYSSLLSWTGIPRWEDLKVVSELIMKYLVEPGQRGRVTALSLATRLNAARRNPGDIAAMVEAQLRFSEDRDEAVEDVLFFLRNWVGHTAPRAIGALDRIQREVLRRFGLSTGNYRFYIAQLEAQFLPQCFINLEEYGLPTQVAQKLRVLGLRGGELDDLLIRLRVVAANPALLEILEPFEQEMFSEVVAGLGPQTAQEV